MEVKYFGSIEEAISDLSEHSVLALFLFERETLRLTNRAIKQKVKVVKDQK